MIFRIETIYNDGYAEAPAFEVEVGEIEELMYILEDEASPFPVGTTMTIERLS